MVLCANCALQRCSSLGRRLRWLRPRVPLAVKLCCKSVLHFRRCLIHVARDSTADEIVLAFVSVLQRGAAAAFFFEQRKQLRPPAQSSSWWREAALEAKGKCPAARN
eukprot:COSAG04_NODE_21179_length_378_cov_1.329749_1_plen_106_part_10